MDDYEKTELKMELTKIRSIEMNTTIDIVANKIEDYIKNNMFDWDKQLRFLNISISYFE